MSLIDNSMMYNLIVIGGGYRQCKGQVGGAGKHLFRHLFSC